MKSGNEFEEAVKKSDLERRATKSKWATFKDGKFLLDSTNIDEEAKRDEAKAMYKADDGVIEVFKIKILPESEIYGKKYLEREGYPSNEDFGKIAWYYSSMGDLAEDKYNSL